MTAPFQSRPETQIPLIHHAPGRCGISEIRNVALYTWWSPALVEDTDAIYRHAKTMSARFPQGASGLHWVKSGAGLPGHGARECFKRILHDFGDHYGEVAVILAAGEGFWAAAMRGMIAGLRMAAPLRVGMRVGTSIEEMVAWLPDAHHKCTGVRVPAAELEGALTALIARG